MTRPVPTSGSRVAHAAHRNSNARMQCRRSITLTQASEYSTWSHSTRAATSKEIVAGRADAAVRRRVGQKVTVPVRVVPVPEQGGKGGKGTRPAAVGCALLAMGRHRPFGHCATDGRGPSDCAGDCDHLLGEMQEVERAVPALVGAAPQRLRLIARPRLRSSRAGDPDVAGRRRLTRDRWDGSAASGSLRHQAPSCRPPCRSSPG
jgi:hypothetical protein